MRRRWFLLAAADAAIDAQVAWYAEHAGVAVATRFYASLKATFRTLAASPGLGRQFVTTHASLDGVRTWPMRGFPFVVYYRVVDEGVEILLVLHGARDRDSLAEGSQCD